MPNLDETITINGFTGTVYALGPTGRKVLIKLDCGGTKWVKVD